MIKPHYAIATCNVTSQIPSTATIPKAHFRYCVQQSRVIHWINRINYFKSSLIQ